MPLCVFINVDEVEHEELGDEYRLAVNGDTPPVHEAVNVVDEPAVIELGLAPIDAESVGAIVVEVDDELVELVVEVDVVVIESDVLVVDTDVDVVESDVLVVDNDVDVVESDVLVVDNEVEVVIATYVAVTVALEFSLSMVLDAVVDDRVDDGETIDQPMFW